jgi:hypothetical protein
MNLNCRESDWILIYAFYESDFGIKTFTREAVYKKYMSKRKTANHQKNFAKNWKTLFKNYISTFNDTIFKFKYEGIGYVKGMIMKGEMDNFKNEYSPALKKEAEETDSKNQSHSRLSNSKKGKNSFQSLSLVTSLNLNDKNVSLKDFYAKYIAKNNFENNLVIIYYLEKIKNLPGITLNHVYTCYKHLQIKVPQLVQSLRDTKNRKGWIDSSNSNDLKVTTIGENYIEFDINKH